MPYPAFTTNFERAVEQRLHVTYYTQLHDWCEAHHIALTGHPAEPDATRSERFFHIPGQDIVWRYIEPDKDSALEGRQSTQAKAAASAMVHGGRRRNANEFCGAYGPELSFDEMRWLANWLLLRGCNLLIPHAFYYSVRGPRRHERPPDLGLSAPWWGEDFTRFATVCAQLSWLNTDSDHHCDVAILGEHHRLPWRAAKACFEQQIDFNYLDTDDLLTRSTISDAGIGVGAQSYKVLVINSKLTADIQPKLDEAANQISVIYWTDDSEACVQQLRQLIPPVVKISPRCPGLRLRYVSKDGLDWIILFNEVKDSADLELEFSTGSRYDLIDPFSGAVSPFEGHLYLAGHDLRILVTERTS